MARLTPAVATLDAVTGASHNTFFFLADPRTFTSFLEKACTFPIAFIFVPNTFADCVKL